MRKMIFSIIASATIMVACSSNTEEMTTGDHKNQNESVLQYKIGSNDWSDVTSVTESPEILEAYQFAVEHPEVLDYMPCYCGCYEEDGHTSNTDCFVDKVEGQVATLDTMGFG
ncbi:putative lipoprotein [Bacillus methanolicus PB1]|uniref:Putative lipoprotein n=2 Tax=Bacillus methanolicus TaxID=1471 RepID=I3DVW5_BACMT|nr:putative lipoprotein [Bacillus methanolicus PB1]